MTSQSGHSVVQRLETGLRDADLVSLRRLLVVQILTGTDCGQDSSPPEARLTDAEGKCKINTDLLILKLIIWHANITVSILVH